MQEIPQHLQHQIMQLQQLQQRLEMLVAQRSQMEIRMKEAEKELPPELKGKVGYFSPFVKIRQMFDLYANMRPCKAYQGNPLNYRDDTNLVIFRENTEGMYAGVEFYPVPENVKKALGKHPKMERFLSIPSDELAISTRIFTRKGCRRIVKSI